jgi:small nuclear ribonucleoprotein (snRNP)-like protein
MQSYTLYQAEPAVVSMLQNVRQTVQSICKEHAKRTVRIEALDGKVYQGQLVNCDGTHVYLEVEEEDEEENDQPEWIVPVNYNYSPCYPYSPSYYPYPPYSPYPYYPYPYPTYTAPIVDSPESPFEGPPRRRRRRCRVIPLALYTLLNIVLI